MWITLDQLLCLRAIKSQGSITAASIELGKAKSALYYSIKKLEEQVGFKVLETGLYRGVLTFKGEQLLTSSESVFKAMEKLNTDIYQIRTGVEQRIGLSATALFSMKKLNKSILKLQQSYPNTEIIFHREILSGEKMLKSGLVDIAIFEHVIEASLFELKKVDEINMQLVISSKHPFLRLSKDQQKLEKLFEYPQVVQRSTIPDEEQYGVYRHSKKWTVSDLASKRQIILDQLGWGRMPSHDVYIDLKAKRLVHLDFVEKPILVPIYIGRLKNKEIGQVGKDFWDMW